MTNATDTRTDGLTDRRHQRSIAAFCLVLRGINNLNFKLGNTLSV